jgi:aconitate hydratase
MTHPNSFGARDTLAAGGRTYGYFRLGALAALPGSTVERLPFSLKVLLENLLRGEDGAFVKRADVEALARWDVAKAHEQEVAYRPARVILQDFTGVPCVVDLAAMRDAITALGGDPERINPLQPVDLVIDHSVQADEYGTAQAFLENVSLEYERNQERYRFLRWGQTAFDNFAVVPPGTGIIHQVNVEYLAQVVFVAKRRRARRAARLPRLARGHRLAHDDGQRPRRVRLGRGRHRGRGGDARPAALDARARRDRLQAHGQAARGRDGDGPVPHRHRDAPQEEGGGQVRRVLRPGPQRPVARRPRDHRQHGARVRRHDGLLPGRRRDAQLPAPHGPQRGADRARRGVHAAQGLFRTDETPDPVYTDTLELDLATVVPSLAGPAPAAGPHRALREQGTYRAHLAEVLAKAGTAAATAEVVSATKVSAEPQLNPAVVATAVAEPGAGGRRGRVPRAEVPAPARRGGARGHHELHQHEQPERDVGRGLLARNAVRKGLSTKPWVKTTLSPGSRVVTDYYDRAGLTDDLDKLGFYLAGYGCMTCIGNSGPLPEPISEAVEKGKLVVSAVLSGNRNFEGRVNPHTRFNYLASPMLVVAYAIAGTMDIDFERDPIGEGSDGPVFLRDIWPSSQEIERTILESVGGDLFAKQYANVFEGTEQWRALDVPEGQTYAWDPESTYVANPPYFAGMTMDAPGVQPVEGARVLGMFGDSITTDHISPAGNIAAASPAGKWLIAHGVKTREFNSYGARRGHHEVMMRGTFANIRCATSWCRAPRAAGRPPAPAASRCRSSTPRCSTRPRARRSSSSPARSTAPAPAATGRPRARCCWACASWWPRASSASTAATWSGWACCRASSPTAPRASRSA